MKRRAAALAVVVAVASCSSSSPPSAQPVTTTAAAPIATPNPTPSPSPSPSTVAEPARIDGQLTTPDGRTRTYHVYVPASVVEPAPLLVALHGGLGSGSQFQANSGFDDVAEDNGFVVVYPDGTEIGGGGLLAQGRVWNGGYCCGPAVAAAVDDVTFVSMVIDEISTEYRIDPGRVYAAGHSNGGIMAYRLACELSARIVAIGLQAGSLGVDGCDPSAPVSVIHVHGSADRNHPIGGGVGPRGVSGVDFHPAIDGVTTLATVDGCPHDPSTEVSPDNADVTVQAWSPCAGGTEVEFVIVEGASHAWMGHPGTAVAAELVGAPYMGFDSSTTIWDFLAAHTRQ